jgi:7-cyano-7-deazaguanine reductase
MPTQPCPALETFPNPHADLPEGRWYEVELECPEFTCLCPRTGQPDFATIRIRYVPDETCVELKSLKLYLWSYRDQGGFHEDVTNRILDDLVAATQPREMTVEGDFKLRGGIHTVVTAVHERPKAKEK